MRYKYRFTVLFVFSMLLCLHYWLYYKEFPFSRYFTNRSQPKKYKMQRQENIPENNNMIEYSNEDGSTKRDEIIPMDILTEVKSPFIYQPPKNVELYSLTYHCANCKLPCKNLTDKISETCRNEQCLCNRNSPILTFPKERDSSHRSKHFMLEAERETLGDPHLTDKKLLPDLSATSVVLLNNPAKLGEEIQLFIQLVDGYGKRLLRGGDDIRVVMKAIDTDKSIAGRVHDYKNGTYFIRVPSVWTGRSTIQVTIPYFREESASLFRWFRHFGMLFYHYGIFKSKYIKQKTLCGIEPNIPGYSDVCDVSLYNGGEPWYCGKPPSKNLTCHDLVRVFDHRFIDIGVTEAEESLFRRVCTDKGRTLQNIEVEVTAGNYNRGNLPPCNQLQPEKTWDLKKTTGYFDGNRYLSTQCQYTYNKLNKTKCLQNTNLIITGDSTVLQWIGHLKSYSKCITNKNYTRGKWYEEMDCVKKEWNMTLKFAPHNMPFSCFDTYQKAIPATKSMATYLNEIPDSGRTIFVLHLYAHFTRHHYNVFRDKLIRLKSALRAALKRNKDLQVFIKSPHIYYCVGWVPTLNDFLGRHIIQILQDELKEFSNRIFYLNYWDMSIAANNKKMHADGNVIAHMINLLLDYTCK